MRRSGPVVPPEPPPLHAALSPALHVVVTPAGSAHADDAVDGLVLSLRRSAETPFEPSRAALRRLLRRHLSPLGAEARQRCIDVLCGAAVDLDVHGDVEVVQSLALVRQALRERLPVDASVRIRAAVRVDGGRVLLDLAPSGDWGGRTRVVSPEGRRGLPLDLTTGVGVHLFEVGSCVDDGWLLELEDGGHRNEVRLPRLTDDPGVAYDTAQRWAAALADRETAVWAAAAEVVTDAALRLWGHAEVGDVCTPARQSAVPDVSLVTALHGDVKLVEHQCAHYASLGLPATIELLYVLGRGDEQHAPALAELGALYGLQLRILLVDQRIDTALGVHLGVLHARARQVVCVSADLLLPSALVVQRLAEVAGRRDSGVVFAAPAGGGAPRTGGLADGMPSSGHRCFAVDRSDYLAAGGLPGGYLGVDFSLAELCRRQVARGRVVLTEPEAQVPGAGGGDRAGISTRFDERLLWKRTGALMLSQTTTNSAGDRSQVPESAGLRGGEDELL